MIKNWKSYSGYFENDFKKRRLIIDPLLLDNNLIIQTTLFIGFNVYYANQIDEVL